MICVDVRLVRFSIASDKTSHPGNNPYLSGPLADALSMGFLLMRTPRIAGVQNPDLKPERYAPSTRSDGQSINEVFGRVVRDVESRGGGRAVIEQLGNTTAATGETWFKGLAHAPSTGDGAVARAVAEWADGDSLGCHVAYECDIFCTRDTGKSAGNQSVLAPASRALLRQDHQVRFMNPQELASHLDGLGGDRSTGN